MNAERQKTVAFAVCGSFCTLGAAVPQAARLAAEGWRVLPVMSFAAAGTDTRFGSAAGWKARLAAAAGHEVLDTLTAVEPLGPQKLADALVIAPCTGATLARLAAGLSDTPVTLAAKSLLRVGCPVVVAVGRPPRPDTLLVAAHSDDADLRPLSTYPYRQVRFLHITGVRRG